MLNHLLVISYLKHSFAQKHHEIAVRIKKGLNRILAPLMKTRNKKLLSVSATTFHYRSECWMLLLSEATEDGHTSIVMFSHQFFLMPDGSKIYRVRNKHALLNQ